MKVSIKKNGDCLKNEDMPVIKEFVKFLKTQLSLTDDVHITLVDKRIAPMTTGVRLGKHRINVLAKVRMLIDILRTIAHEWVHEYQHQKMGLKDTDKIQDIGGPEENMCNILSGIFIKKFQKNNPEFEHQIYHE